MSVDSKCSNVFGLGAVCLIAALFCGCGGDGPAEIDAGDDTGFPIDGGADVAVPDLVPADQGNDGSVSDDIRVEEDGADDDAEISVDDGIDVTEPDDALDAGDQTDDVPGDSLQDGEGPVGLDTAIGDELDESFLVPNRGLALKMATRLLPEYPSSGLGAGDTAGVLSAELLLPSGEAVLLEDRDSAFATLYPMDGYDDSWVFINAAGNDSDESHRYTLNLYPALSTLAWMKDTGVSDISCDYAGFVIYREGWFNGAYVSCPAVTGASPSLSQMRVYFEADTLQAGQPIGLMLNSYVTDDRKEITTMFGAAAYHETCRCYDVDGSGYSERTCGLGDIDQYPTSPAAVTPYDGEEGVTGVGTVLRWTASVDPDGGDVTYDVWLGTDETSLTQVMDDIQVTEFTPALVPDAQYYWRVDVTDDEGNLLRGQVWTFDTDTGIPEIQPHNYLILVDKRLKGQLDADLEQYVQDIVDQEGLVPAIRYWMPGDHIAMRALIIDSFANRCVSAGDCLRGVFMIGDLPSAWYEQDSDFGGDIGIMHEEFPTELFFQDLDCQWLDSDGNGIFDGHGDFALEIFTSRLVGDVARMRTYFARLHEYRTGGSFFSPRTFFSFIDDDWNGANASGTPDAGVVDRTWELDSIYAENYIRREWEDSTDKTDYLGVMAAGGAEFVYQWIHSDPQQIYFDDNFSPNPENILSLQELVAADVQGSFFNLFDCSISRYTESQGNIATEYVYSDRGLATIGSTKTGGIFNPEVLHGAMRDGLGVGQALRLWFDDTWLNRDAYGLPDPVFDDWWLGMMVQGDPLVLLNPEAPVGSVRNPRVGDRPLGSRVFDLSFISSLYEVMGRRAVGLKLGDRAEYLRRR